MERTALRQKFKALQPATLNARNQAVVRAWNLMGGEIDWQGVDAIAELLGITNIEGFMVGLIELRDYKEQVHAHTSQQG